MKFQNLGTLSLNETRLYFVTQTLLTQEQFQISLYFTFNSLCLHFRSVTIRENCPKMQHSMTTFSPAFTEVEIKRNRISIKVFFFTLFFCIVTENFKTKLPKGNSERTISVQTACTPRPNFGTRIFSLNNHLSLNSRAI